MTATAIPRRILGRAVATRLVGVTNATGYYGQIGAKNGLVVGTPAPADPPPKSPTDQRVAPYFILFPGIGRPTDEADLADTYVDLETPFTVQAAAGDVDDLLALVERIDALLWRWSPGVLTTTSGPVVCGPLRTPPGYDPRLLIDQAKTPPRHYTPLQYQLTAHT
ncbi:hypothetical protein [Nocardioides sp. PD653]|uniref:hypothetical protein n=1 Tax=Nocardioides sp. PD653 TaxID=393303 RepID=UPI0009F0BC5E|nr:hypothetical protein [Nocardioides sp. PD653]GAW54744.1 hypothetical protein PD653_2158 [Nocardioides sp. PD653]